MKKPNGKSIALTAMGIALYAVLSMTVKIPLIGHIAVDLGYIVLGVYAYCFGVIPGMVVGCCGAAIISTLTGWFAPGWALGNLLVGLICGVFFDRSGTRMALLKNILITWGAVALGIMGIKTVVDCVLYQSPWQLKLLKDTVATVVDSLAMCFGVWLAPKIGKMLPENIQKK